MIINSNKARCKLCGDVIESKHRRDVKHCSCGALEVTGGLEFIKRFFYNREDYEELSEYEVIKNG